jgi:hypothetical protein
MAALRFCITILALLLCLAAPAFAQDLVTPSDRVISHVNIRASADEAGQEIGHLEIGQALRLVRSVPRWYEVELPGGQTGFGRRYLAPSSQGSRTNFAFIS